MTAQQLAETAARSLRGALDGEDQTPTSRREIAAYWRRALAQLGVAPPTDFCELLGFCDRLARPARSA